MMEKFFWQDKWQRGDTAFHYDKANPLLLKHFPKFNLSAGSQVLIPLCGKTADMKWLLDQGLQIVGVDLIRDPIEQFFATHQLTPEITEESGYTVYSSPGIRLYCGDFFHTPAALLQNTQLVYDRAALVALPSEMRQNYYPIINHALDYGAQYLLLTFDFDKAPHEGPPFNVPDVEIRQALSKPIKLLEQKGMEKVFAIE